MHNHASIAYCISTDCANIIIIIIILILICNITKSELRAEMQEQKECKIECQVKALHGSTGKFECQGHEALEFREKKIKITKKCIWQQSHSKLVIALYPE